MQKYIYLIGRIGEDKPKITGNAYLINYYDIPKTMDINIKKFLLYLYEKNYTYYHIVNSKAIVVEIKNSKERRKLIPILYYYKLIPYTFKAIINDTVMPNSSNLWKLIEEGEGIYKAIKIG